MEQVDGVVGAGAGLGVVLHAKHRVAQVGHALQGAVVQVDVGGLEVLEGVGVYRVAVVLAGDLDLAGEQVLDRVVGPPVPKLELEGAPPSGQAQKLVARQMPKVGRRPISFQRVSWA